VRTSRTVSAGTGLTGGGDLSADRTLSADFATQAEAEAGTNTTKLMNPLRTAQAISALTPAFATQAEAEAGTASDRAMSPLRTAQHVAARIATQAEAEAGTDTTKVMSPQRTAQHVTARIATQAEAEAGTNTTKVMSPQRTAQAIAALAPVRNLPTSVTDANTALDTGNYIVVTPHTNAPTADLYRVLAFRSGTQGTTQLAVRHGTHEFWYRCQTSGVFGSWVRVVDEPRLDTLRPAPVIVGPTATTSGTAFEVTDIPTWVRTITLNAVGVSLSGNDSLLLQLGTDNAFITTGYTSCSATAVLGVVTSSTGFVVFMPSAATRFTGQVRVDLVPGSVAVSSHTGCFSVGTNNVVNGGGSVDIPNPITRIRLTRTGSDTFDNGSFSVTYSA
jgi:hypothetical protein